MEMRVTEIEQELGQVISMEEFESFLVDSELGIRIIDEMNNSKEVEVEEIMNKLNLDSIQEIYYIKDNNSVKILFINGCIHELERV
jgi:hypothetical protein